MKARLTTLFCLLLALTLSLAGGFYSMASLPSSPPPPGVNGETTIEVPVEIIPSSSSGSQLLQEDTIATIVSEQLELSSGATPYLKASVKVLYDDSGQPDYLVVYLPHRESWLFETVKIELGKNYRVLSVEKDYVEQENDLYEEQSIAATCPDNDVQIVLGCTTTEFPSSVTATNNSYNAAVAAGYETVKLLGSQENTTAVKNWLSCPNLLYYGRIGHGNSSGILLYDGSLTVSNYWDSMAGQLPGKILYFNSCQVFNNPLKTSIFNTGVAKFIGGICSLWVGTSEPVWQCWNQHNFVQDPPPGGQEDEMCYWSQQCESDMNYPDPGCHGCGGPGPHIFPEPGPPGPTPTPTNTPEPGNEIFFDDFETNKGWTVNPSGADTATTGTWERANPEGVDYNGPKQLNVTHSGSYDLVTGPLAGSSAGSYDIDGGVTSIRSPNMTLPTGEDITFSFYYYLAHYSNSGSDDFLRVKVVGSTTQTVFEELGAADNDDAAWAYFSTSLNSFAGQTIYLLIEAADNGSGSLVEAAIDDVLVTPDGAPLPTPTPTQPGPTPTPTQPAPTPTPTSSGGW